MLENMLWSCALILAGILFYRFGVPAFRRFDAQNVRRIAQQEQDKSDPEAHFRHTLDVADEQVEPVQEIRVGDTVRYLFETEIFSNREDAEEKRAMRVGVLARRFYQDLPDALAGATSGAQSPRGPMSARAPLSARERAAQRWSRRGNETIH